MIYSGNREILFEIEEPNDKKLAKILLDYKDKEELNILKEQLILNNTVNDKNYFSIEN